MSDVRAGKAYIEIGTKVDTSALAKLKGNLGSLFNAQRFGDGLRSIELKMRNFAVSARNLGLDLIKFGAIAATPIIFSGKQFADFESAMARVSTFLGENQAKMVEFKKEVLRLSEVYGVSAVKVADGLSEILSASIPAGEALAFLDNGLKGSIGNFVDFNEQMHGVIALTSAYGRDVLSAAKATELFRVIVDDGIIPAKQLADEIGNVASNFANAGLSAEDLVASYTAVSQSAISVSQQTTAIANVVNSFASAAPEAAEKFFELSKKVTGTGVEMSLANLKMLGLTKTLQILQRASPDTLAKIFPDNRAFKGATVLTSNIDLFTKSLEKSRVSSTLADSAYAKMSKTLSHFKDVLVTKFQNIAVELGETLADTFRSVGAALIDTLKIVSSFIKQNPELTISLAKMAAAALTIGGALMSVALVFSIFSTSLGGIVAVGSVVSSVFMGLIGVIGGFIGFLFSSTGVVAAFGVALTSVFVDFGKIFSNFASGFSNIFSNIRNSFNAFVFDISKTFKSVKQAIAIKDYDLAVKIIVNKVKIIWFEAVNSITEKIETIKIALNKIKQIWFSVVETISAKVQDFVSSFSMSFDDILVQTKIFINKISMLFTNMSAEEIYSGIGETFSDLFQDMDGTLNGFFLTWIRIWGAMREVATATVKAIKDIWGGLKEFTIQGIDFLKAGSSKTPIREKFIAYHGKKIKDKATEVANLEKMLLSKGATKPSEEDRQKIVSQLSAKSKELVMLKEEAKTISELLKLRKEASDKKLVIDNAGAGEDIAYERKKYEEILKEISRKTGTVSLPYSNEVRDSFFPDTKIQTLFDQALSTSQEEKKLSDENFKNDIDNIYKETNAASDALKITFAEEKKLNAAARKAKTADYYNNLLKNQKDLENEASSGAGSKAAMESFKRLFPSLEQALGAALPTNSVKKGGDGLDIPLAEKEKKKIVDGVMGAFDISGLGDYSKGDPAKSALEIQKDLKREAVEQNKQLKDLIMQNKEIARNTKEQFRYS